MINTAAICKNLDRPWMSPAIRGVALLAVAPLFFARLGATYLWQDEAQTALLGRQVLRRGLPFTGRGPANASALAGRDSGALGLFVHIPPAQAYLAAAGMALFGETALGARFFFALSGFTCVCLLPWAMGRSWPPGTATAAQVVLGLHVPFLLFARQARYYALASLLLLAAVGFLVRLIPNRKGKGGKTACEMGLAIVLVLLALTFEFAYVAAIGVALLLFAWKILFCSEQPILVRVRQFWFALPSVLTFVAWLALAGTAPSRRGGQGFNESAPDFPAYFLGQVNAYVVPLVVVSALLVCYGIVRLWEQEGRRRHGLADGYLVVALLVSGLHLTVCTFTTHRFPRYIVPVVPLLVGVAVATLYRVTAPVARRWWGRGLRIFVLLLLVSGLWSGRDGSGRAWLPWERRLEEATDCRWSRRNGVHLGAYLRELYDPPRGPVGRAVEYLRVHARPGATVVAEYGEKPLKFHTACAVFGGETGELPPGSADWIWPRHIPAPWWEIKRARGYIAEQLARGTYEAIELPGTIDSIWENRPDPEWHVFTEDQRQTLFPDAPPVRLYRRRPPR